MCGDDYSVELILSSMLQQNDCYSNPDKQDTIMLETVIEGTRKKIAVTLGSYHRKYKNVFITSNINHFLDLRTRSQKMTNRAKRQGKCRNLGKWGIFFRFSSKKIQCIL